MKRTFITGILLLSFLLLTTQFTNAALTDQLLSYYSNDVNADPIADDHMDLNLTHVGSPTFTSTCKEDDCYIMDTGDEASHVTLDFGDTLNGTTDVCLAAWIKFPSTIGTGAYQWLFVIHATSDTNKYALAVTTDTATPASNLNFVTNDGSFYDSAPFTPKKNSFNYYVFCHNGSSRWQAWENNTIILNETHSSANPPGTFELEFMDNGGASGIPNGVTWDEIAIWNRMLTTTERTDLFNSGSGKFYPFSGGGGGSLNYHIIHANDLYDNSDIQNVNVTLDNGLDNLTNSTGDVTFHDLNSSQNYTATLSPYYTVTGNATVNNTVTANMWQRRTNLSYFNTNGDAITVNGDVLVVGARTYSAISDTTWIYVAEQNNTLTVAATGYFNRSLEFNYTSVGNYTTNFTNLSNVQVVYTGITSNDILEPTCTIDSVIINTSDFFAVDAGNTTVSCSAASGYDAFTYDINWSDTALNISINVSEHNLNLTFSTTTSGVIYDEIGDAAIWNWSNEVYINKSLEFCDGGTCYVTVEFNSDGTGEQHYQYIASPNTAESAFLEVLSTMNSQLTVQTIGIDNNPITDVRIRASKVNDSGTGTNLSTNFVLIGQRYTDTEGGMTSFYVEDNDYILLTAYLEGYNNYSTVIEVDEFTNTTRDDPFKIVMENGYDNIFASKIFHRPDEFNGNDTTLQWCGYSTSDATITWSTSYEGVNRLAEFNEYQQNCVNMTNGTHYEWASFTLTIDGKTSTVSYVNERDVTLGFPSRDGKLITILLLIALITLSIFIGAYTNTQEGKTGFTVFSAGCIILALGQFTAFYLPSIIFGIYYAATILFKNQEAL